MKYKCMTIDVENGEWRCRLRNIPGDRICRHTIPSANGYYYYDQNSSSTDAFKKLKSCMVRAHRKRISELQDSLHKLMLVKLDGDGS